MNNFKSVIAFGTPSNSAGFQCKVLEGYPHERQLLAQLDSTRLHDFSEGPACYGVFSLSVDEVNITAIAEFRRITPNDSTINRGAYIGVAFAGLDPLELKDWFGASYIISNYHDLLANMRDESGRFKKDFSFEKIEPMNQIVDSRRHLALESIRTSNPSKNKPKVFTASSLLLDLANTESLYSRSNHDHLNRINALSKENKNLRQKYLELEDRLRNASPGSAAIRPDGTLGASTSRIKSAVARSERRISENESLGSQDVKPLSVSSDQIDQSWGGKSVATKLALGTVICICIAALAVVGFQLVKNEPSAISTESTVQETKSNTLSDEKNLSETDSAEKTAGNPTSANSSSLGEDSGSKAPNRRELRPMKRIEEESGIPTANRNESSRSSEPAPLPRTSDQSSEAAIGIDDGSSEQLPSEQSVEDRMRLLR